MDGVVDFLLPLSVAILQMSWTVFEGGPGLEQLAFGLVIFLDNIQIRLSSQGLSATTAWEDLGAVSVAHVDLGLNSEFKIHQALCL